jgi:hypothetical protein
VECCLRRDPQARLTAEELLAHPFLARHRQSGEERGRGGGFDGWGSTSNLFGALETSDANAARLFSALLRHLNAAGSGGGGSRRSSGGRGGGAPHGDGRPCTAEAAPPGGAEALVGLCAEQLASLCAQLPGLGVDRATRLHDHALQALRDQDARLVAAAAARVFAAAQAPGAASQSLQHRRRGYPGAERSERREQRK